MRCFLSIDLSAETRKEISRIQSELPKDAKYILVKPEIVHLTMKFLGEIDDEKTEKVKEMLKKLNFSRFKARIKELSVFSPSFIKVVYLDVEPRAEFDKMHAIIEKLLSLEDFQQDAHWESHATLARVKSIKDKKKFLEDIRKIKINPIEFTVDNITLKKSILTPEGPVYGDLFTLKFN